MRTASVKEKAQYNPVKATGLSSLTKEDIEKLKRVNQTDRTPETCLHCTKKKCSGSRTCYVNNGGK